MNHLASIGVVLLLALLAGHLVRAIRVPEVTGYLLAGVVLGPSAIGWLSRTNLDAMGVLAEVALGLILFSVGSVFELSRFRRFGRQVLILTAAESALAFAAVFIGVMSVGQEWRVAMLLASVAIATAPASTLMVVRESDAAGPFTDSLLGIVAVNNLLCIVAYSLAAASIDLAAAMSGSGHVWASVYRLGYLLTWQLVGSVALGYLVGVLLAAWSAHVRESGEMLILLIGSVLLGVGAARWLELSPLIASLTIGATLVNLAAGSRRFFTALATTDPPFYAIFFVIAGAELDVALIPAMGGLGVMYLACRAGGKYIGVRVASRRLALDLRIQRFLGMSLWAQAGLAIGITLAINQRFPALAAVVSTVVLGAVAVSEMIGPVATRFALGRSGEVGLADPAPPSETLLESPE